MNSALRQQKRRKSQSPFDHWWINSRGGLGPLRFDQRSPHDAAKAGFEAGQKSVPTSKKLRKAMTDVLQLLEVWDAGFDGFSEVNEAEKLLGRRTSKIK